MPIAEMLKFFVKDMNKKCSKIKLKKIAKFSTYGFLATQVEVKGPVKNSRIKPGKEVRVGRLCLYTLVNSCRR